MKSEIQNARKALAEIIAAACVLSLSGCAGIFRELRAGSFQAYPGTRLPWENVAFLSTIVEYPHYKTETDVVALDGKAIEGGIRTEFLELLPGKHALCVSFRDSREYAHACVNLEIEVKPGRLYQLYSVKYTQWQGWHPALWDVTDELDFPQQAKTRAAFDHTLTTTGRKPLPPTSDAPAAGGRGLAGFGERKRMRFPGKAGKEVTAEYDFIRYAPFIRVAADDGRTYHLRVSQTDGAVAVVLGTEIDRDRRTAFQPMDSDLAYVYGHGVVPANEVFAVYREISPGNYRLIKQVFSVSFQNVFFSALLEATIVDGQDVDARRALVLAMNADPEKLVQKQTVVNMLMKRSKGDQKEFRKNLNQYALLLAREAARAADTLAAKYPAGDPRYERVREIVNFVKEKLKEREGRE